MKSKNLHVGSTPTARSGRFWAWGPAVLIGAAIFAASSLPRAQLPEVGFPGIDKLEHGLAYGLLGAALARGWRWQRPSWRSAATWFAAWVTALAYGLGDELHQLLVPGRMFDLADLLADGVGAALGAAAYLRLLLWAQSRDRAGPLPGKERS
jgi:VanZ family protein